jgi:energy-coupling factor transporter ATP-binding protein EcfA2/energy-coupling factor transporter transmembrane protein EcfT
MGADWLLKDVEVAQGDMPLLRDANIRFRAGEITLVIGSNGAGKSTLLETMVGLRSPAAGQITLGGLPLWLTDKRKPRLNKDVALKFGISLQSSEAQWFAATVREEFAYSLKPYKLAAAESTRRSSAAMAQVGLPPELLERDPWTLSGGQQRKLSLACLLACEPEWLLLDEPTAGLDTAGVGSLCKLLEAHRAAGHGAVIVTHDLDALLPLADAVVSVAGGVVHAAERSAEFALNMGQRKSTAVELQLHATVRAVGAGVVRRDEASAVRGEGAGAVRQDEVGAVRGAGAGAVRQDEVGAVRQDEAVAADDGDAQLPQALRALALLRASAALPPQAPPADRGGAPWPEPRVLAAALAMQLALRERAQAGGGALPAAPQGHSRRAPAAAVAERRRPEAPAASPSSRSLPAAAPKAPGLAAPERFDPRMLLIVFLLLSTGIFAGQSLTALACAAGVTGLLLIPFRRQLKPWLRLLRAYGMMLALFCLIGGINLSPLSFDWERVLPIVLRFGKLLLAMLLAMPMLHLLTPMRLQRGLEQTFGWLARYKVPVHAFALLVTLIFRFIPLLAAEWGRFAKLSHARGKAASPSGTVPLRMIRPLLIPYIRSILRMAEEMADALEARGFSHVKQKPVYAFRLRFNPVDWKLLAVAASATLGLWILAYLL